MDPSKTEQILQNIGAWAPQDRKSRLIGTITDYIPMILANPKLSDLAHARLYHMIEAAGTDWTMDEYTGDRKPSYRFFQDEMFGLDETLAKIVGYFDSGGRRLPTRKRILLIMGPVGGGKSTIVQLLKNGIEAYTATDEGAVYSIVGCPIHEDPLNMLPDDLRRELSDMTDGQTVIEGQLCPACKKRLDGEFAGDFRKFEIERIFFGELTRKGVGTYMPSDPKSQDVSELIGSVNLAKMAEIGIESDPDAYQFDGEVNISNRGMLEMIEMLKCDIKHLQVLLTVTQEQQVKMARFPMCYVNLAIVAHTNETEWNSFMGKKENEALQDRIITIRCPYVLTVSNEVKIYRKELGRSQDASDVAIAPRTLDVCAMFAVLSRLDPPKDGTIDLVKKMKAYDGQDVKDVRVADVRRMRKDAENEGMNGIGPRTITNAISQAITSVREQFREMSEDEFRKDCFGLAWDRSEPISVDAVDMLKMLTKMIEDDPRRDDVNDRKEMLGFLEMARREYDDLVKRDVQRAFCYEFQEEAETLFKNYLKNVVAFCNQDELRDDVTGEHTAADNTLMSGVEKMIKVGEGNAREFREGIMRRMATAGSIGKQFDFEAYADLREAIEKRIFEDRKDIISITTTSRHPDPEQMKEINRVIRHLVEHTGDDPLIRYTTYTAARAVRYVGKLLNR